MSQTKVNCKYCSKQYATEKTLKTHLKTCVKKILKEDEEEDMKRENELKQSFETKLSETIHHSKDKDLIIKDLNDRIDILLSRNAILESLCKNIVEQIEKTL